MNVKEKVIQTIYSLLGMLDYTEFNIETNIGIIYSIEKRNDGKRISLSINNSKGGINSHLFCDADNCKMTTLFQIVQELKYEVIYSDYVGKLKNKKNFWNEKRKMWTHQPIEKSKIMEKIKNENRPKRYVAKRSNGLA